MPNLKYVTLWALNKFMFSFFVQILNEDFLLWKKCVGHYENNYT